MEEVGRRPYSNQEWEKEYTTSAHAAAMNNSKMKTISHALTGAFQTNCCETSSQDEIIIKSMRGDSIEDTVHADITAAAQNEMDWILADLSTEDITTMVLKTISAVMAAIVKAVQKQLDLCVDKRKNILEYNEDKLEQ